ncbi:MAG: glycosyltransferase family 39 protein [Pirellulales bacterium]
MARLPDARPQVARRGNAGREALWDEKFRSDMIGRKVGITRIFLHAVNAILPNVDAGTPQQSTCDAFPRTAESLRRFGRMLALLVLASVLVRIPGITRPLVGNFATKSAVYAMIARNWVLDRAALSRPTIDLAAGDSRAWHLMEWPASAYFAGWGWRTFGGSLDAWGRGVSILCSAVAVMLMGVYARRRLGDGAALVAASVIAFSPVSIVYGQCFMLEASVMMFTVGTLLGFERGLAARRTAAAAAWLAFAATACSLAVATKIYMLLLVPVLAAMLWEQHGRQPLKLQRCAVTGLLFAAAMLPTALWYLDVARISLSTPEAADHHPLDRAVIHAFPHPLLLGAKYYLRLSADFATHVLTPVGALAMSAGFVVARRKLGPANIVLLVMSLGLLIALPLKFYAANYYYIVLLPALALVVAAGWQVAADQLPHNTRLRAALVVVAFLFAIRYAVGPAFRTPSGDRAVETAAAAAQRNVAINEPLATLHGSAVDLLYYCDRRGWALNADDAEFAARLNEAILGGARKLLVADLPTAHRRTTTSDVLKRLPLLASGDDWQLLELPTPALHPSSQSRSLAQVADAVPKESVSR